MPRLPPGRQGTRVTVKGRRIEFTCWPSRPGRIHRGLQSTLFALDPWAIIRQVVDTRCPAAARPEAIATLEQSEDFFQIGTGPGVEAARPLALYYSYLNLLKTFCLTKSVRPSFDQSMHGLRERLRPARNELIDAYLEADPSGNRIQNFDELHAALTGAHLQQQIQFDLTALLPQILPGHRLWAQASGRQERFVAIHDLQFWHDEASHQLWLRLLFRREDLTRLNLTHKRLLQESGISTLFSEVAPESGELVCFEQIIPTPCPNNHPADHLHSVVDVVRRNIWSTVATVPPYRRHYVYLSPPSEAAHRLPQLLSMFAVTFYLGSITRYRPHHFDAILRGPYGPRIRDFVTGQPAQFLYIMTSELAERDVTRPSIL